MIRPWVCHLCRRRFLHIIVHVFIPASYININVPGNESDKVCTLCFTQTNPIPSTEKSILEPVVEVSRPFRGGRSIRCKRPKVVSGAAGADDEDALLPEGSQGLAQVIVVMRVLVRLDRELADGDVGLRVHEHERHPCAVVEAPILVHLDAPEACLLQQLLHPVGEFRRPWCRILDLAQSKASAVITKVKKLRSC